MSADVAYHAGWVDAPDGPEMPTGDNIEAAARISENSEAKAARAEEREREERLKDREDLEQTRIALGLQAERSLAEVLGDTSKAMDREDRVSERAEAKARDQLLANPVEEDPTDLRDLRWQATLKARKAAEAKLAAAPERRRENREQARAAGAYVPEPVEPFKPDRGPRRPAAFVPTAAAAASHGAPAARSQAWPQWR